MNKYGFTLIELLAVVVVLAIILAISIPTVSGIIKSSTKGAFENDAKMVLQQLEYEKLKDRNFDVTTVDENAITNYELSNDNYMDLVVGILNNQSYIIIVGQNKWKDLKACGTIRNMAVVDISDTTTCQDISAISIDYNAQKGVNRPKLVTGMTPIKWNGTDWVSTNADDPDWYNYDTTNKQWANARTADGSMWVWIPRYVYKISTNWHSNTTGTIDIQFSKSIDDNWNNAVIGNIDTGATSDASNNKWTNHPAFTFGTIELTGIWVAKFEATAAEGVANGYTSDGSCPITGDDVTTKTIKSIPNAKSWRCITVNNIFTNARNMEINQAYGWTAGGIGIDTHLMKNNEWGVVAYLSKSQYGQNDNEIWINPADDYTTGCAGDSTSSSSTTSCLRTYDSTNGQRASTTGNIYGIYDLSGGSWEYIAGYLNNGHSNLNTNASVVTNAASQYKNVYAVGGTDDQVSNYALTIDQKGDAAYETSNNVNGAYAWFNDYIFMPNTTGPLFIRGGRFTSGTNAGVFTFTYSWGGVLSYASFRPVLLIGQGL